MSTASSVHEPTVAGDAAAGSDLKDVQQIDLEAAEEVVDLEALGCCCGCAG
ncbi:MAG: hypothetical protein ACREX3_01535 [Gammaproteobacteria bacterium]